MVVFFGVPFRTNEHQYEYPNQFKDIKKHSIKDEKGWVMTFIEKEDSAILITCTFDNAFEWMRRHSKQEARNIWSLAKQNEWSTSP